MTLYRRRTASCKAIRRGSAATVAEIGEVASPPAAVVFDQVDRAPDLVASAPHSPAARRTAGGGPLQPAPAPVGLEQQRLRRDDPGLGGRLRRDGPRRRDQARPLGRRPPGRSGLEYGQPDQQSRAAADGASAAPAGRPADPARSRPPRPRPAPGSGSSIRDAASGPGRQLSVAGEPQVHQSRASRHRRPRAASPIESPNERQRQDPDRRERPDDEEPEHQLPGFAARQGRGPEQAQPDGTVVGRCPRAASAAPGGSRPRRTTTGPAGAVAHGRERRRALAASRRTTKTSGISRNAAMILIAKPSASERPAGGEPGSARRPRLENDPSRPVPPRRRRAWRRRAGRRGHIGSSAGRRRRPRRPTAPHAGSAPPHQLEEPPGRDGRRQRRERAARPPPAPGPWPVSGPRPRTRTAAARPGSSWETAPCRAAAGAAPSPAPGCGPPSPSAPAAPRSSRRSADRGRSTRTRNVAASTSRQRPCPRSAAASASRLHANLPSPASIPGPPIRPESSLA